MFEFKPLPLATVEPKFPALLQDGYFVKFSDEWPATLSHITYQDENGKTRGKFFRVGPVNQVPYDLSYKLPTGDFRDVDFSNTLSAFNENLYPAQPKTLYETLMGFKKGNFLVHLYIPAGEYQKRLEQSNMVPNVVSATLRYLGALKPADSPYYDKRFYFYSVWNMEPFIMRLFVDSGVGFEKVVVGLVVNKCFLNEIPPNKVTKDMSDRAKLIRYYTEERW